MTRLAFRLSGFAAFAVLTVLLALALGACATIADTSHDHADNVRSERG